MEIDCPSEEKRESAPLEGSRNVRACLKDEIAEAETALEAGHLKEARDRIVEIGKNVQALTHEEAAAAVGLIQEIMAVELFLYSELEAPEITGAWIRKLREKRVSNQLVIAARIEAMVQNYGPKTP